MVSNAKTTEEAIMDDALFGLRAHMKRADNLGKIVAYIQTHYPNCYHIISMGRDVSDEIFWNLMSIGIVAGTKENNRDKSGIRRMLSDIKLERLALGEVWSEDLYPSQIKKYEESYKGRTDFVREDSLPAHTVAFYQEISESPHSYEYERMWEAFGIKQMRYFV